MQYQSVVRCTNVLISRVFFFKEDEFSVEWDSESEEDVEEPEDNQRRESTLRDDGETASASNIRTRSPSRFDQSQPSPIIEKNKKSDLHSNIDPNVSEAPRIVVDDNFVKLWRSVKVDGKDDINIEEYLNQQKNTVMQGQGMRKVALKRKPIKRKSSHCCKPRRLQ